MNPTEFLQQRRAEKRRTKARRKAAKVRERREALPREERNDLIQAEFRRLLRLPLWRREFARRKAWAPITLQIQRSRSDRTSGRAWSSGKTHIRIGMGADWARICQMLVHELAHHGAGFSAHHGDKFCSVLTEAMHQAYGVELSELPESRGGRSRSVRHTGRRADRAEKGCLNDVGQGSGAEACGG